MDEVLREIDRLRREGRAVAVATIVDARGSTPRPTGARLSVSSDGRVVGSLSGGCVEADIVEKARMVLANGSPVLARYSADDDADLGVGLSCAGTIEVLIEPIFDDDPWQVAIETVSAGRPIVLATALSPPSLCGRHLAVGQEGRSGSIADGLDERVEAEAERLLASGGEDGRLTMLEQGKTRIFVELLLPSPRLFLVGATDIAVAAARIAREVGFHVTIIEPRAAYSARAGVDAADALVEDWPDQALAAVGLDEQSYVVTLTHDAKLDVPALAAALRSPCRYVGALGSRRTQSKRAEALLGLGLTPRQVDKIHGPVGLDLGGRVPAEIALAIVAELVAVRHGGDRHVAATDESECEPVTGIILAAGSSTRMGEPKQLLDMGGRPLLQWVIDNACRSRLDEIVVVLGAHAEEIEQRIVVPAGGRVRVAYNPEHASGLASSLKAGLRACAPKAAAVAVLLGDQPNVTSTLINQVVEAFRGSMYQAVRPLFVGDDSPGVPGHPVVISRAMWPDLERLSGDQGAGRLLAAHPEWVEIIRLAGQAPVDVDSRADYDGLLAARAGSSATLARPS